MKLIIVSYIFYIKNIRSFVYNISITFNYLFLNKYIIIIFSFFINI